MYSWPFIFIIFCSSDSLVSDNTDLGLLFFELCVMSFIQLFLSFTSFIFISYVSFHHKFLKARTILGFLFSMILEQNTVHVCVWSPSNLRFLNKQATIVR